MKSKIIVIILLILVIINIQDLTGIDNSASNTTEISNIGIEVVNDHPIDDYPIKDDINPKISADPLTTISIDGDLADWESIFPIFYNYEPDYSNEFEIDTAYIVNNESHLFFRVSFIEANPHFEQIFINISLALPNGSVYIIMASVDYSTATHYPYLCITEGRDIDSPYNAQYASFVLTRYDAAVSADNRTIEFGFLLSDLDIQYTDLIDMVFWSMDDLYRYPKEYSLDYPIIDPRLQNYNPHDPILAYSETELDNLAITYGWIGDGSETSPYILNNISIDSEWGKCIDLQNIDSYIVINNSYLTGYDDGIVNLEFCNLATSSWITFENTFIVSVYNTAITLFGTRTVLFDNCSIISRRAVDIVSSDTLDFVNNYIQGIEFGINMEYTYSSNLSLNEIRGNDGINLVFSSNNQINFNTLIDSEIGINFYLSPSNTINGNDFINTGISMSGSYVEDFIQTEVSSNIINGKPLIFWQHETNKTVPVGAGAIVLINCTKIEVTNQTISDTTTGLLLVKGTNNNIHHNNFTNNYVGIDATFPENNNFTNNYFIDNQEAGLALYSSPNNIVESNIFENCDLYIPAYYEDEMDQILQQSVQNNTVNGKPLLYWVSVDSATVPSFVGQIILIDCTNIDIEHLTFNGGNVQAVSIYYSIDVDIYDCSFINLGERVAVYSRYSSLTDIYQSDFDGCEYGIYLGYSYSNIVDDNNIDNCYLGIYSSSQVNISIGSNNIFNCNYGIYNYRSNYTFIYNNYISNSQWQGIQYSYCSEGETLNNTIVEGNDGISLILTDGLVFDSNFIEENSGSAFFVSSSNDIVITDNMLSLNSEGIYCANIHNTIIEGNYISNNTFIGIRIDSSGDNLIAWNTFMSNGGGWSERQVEDWGYDDYNNTLYCNFWSDWLSPDNDGDGIVDVPYELGGDRGTVDSKPLADGSLNLVAPQIIYPIGNEIIEGFTTIQWTEAIDRYSRYITYDIFYSDDSGANWYSLYSNLYGTEVEWDTSSLENGDNYLIKVEASNGAETVIDISDAVFSIFNEIVHQLSSPTVIYPNGGETLSGIVTVTWTAAIDSFSYPVTYEFYFSKTGGSTWVLVAASQTETSYDWNTAYALDSTDYLVRIIAKSAELATEDVSDAVFTVKNTPEHKLSDPTIAYPNGGETLSGMVTIVWLASVDTHSLPVTYQIYFSSNNGVNWYLIESNVSTRNYSWDTTTVTNGNDYKIKIVATAGDLIAYDVTDNTFSISNSNGTSSSSESDTTSQIVYTPGMTAPFLIISMIAMIAFQQKRK